MKRLLSCFLLLSIILTCTACELDSLDSSTSPADPNQIELPFSYSSLQYIHYNDAIAKLTEAGFTNIKTEVLYDIITGFLTSDGDVDSVSINGNTTFSKGDFFPKDAEIIVTYHTWMSNKPSDDTKPSVPDGSAAVPSASYSYSGKYYQDVISELEEAGFTNIRTEILYDIITGWLTSDGDVESVSIDGNTSFSKWAVFNKDAEIVVTYHTWESNSPDKITLTMNASDFIGLDQSNAEAKLREMGFTIFSYQTTVTYDKSEESKIYSVEIVDWIIGYDDFKTGDKFDPDVEVILCYYEYKEPTKPSPVFYSTNDYETAKKGNSGVFSYRSRGAYDVYWIIDFDEGYAYNFTDGNGESHCDKIKILSGDLNSIVKLSYYIDGTEWIWCLHFKYQSHPETLVLVDHNDISLEYSTTDLENALELRNTKKITEFSKPSDPSIDTTSLEYTINSDGKTCTISSIGICADAQIKIPQYIDGYQVNAIGEWAFDMCQTVTSVVIPDGVTRIDDFAFYGCSNLKSVQIPNSVIEIGSSVFSGCFALTTITLPDRITIIEPATFQGCYNLTKITIPDSVTHIGDLAFENCTSLTEITLPGTLIEIGVSFTGCSKLTTINYKGTKSSWLSLNRIFDWDDRTGNYTVNCIDGEISKTESVGSMPAIPDNTEPSKHNYVLNTSTKKYHIDGCWSADRIAEENKSYYYGTEEELIAMGYSPCGHCDP